MRRDHFDPKAFERWLAEEIAKMSVTFTIRGVKGSNRLNMSVTNAANLLEWLGYMTLAEDLVGEIGARALRVSCELALKKPVDGPVAGEETRGEGGALYIRCERWPGYLHEKTQELLELTKQAGDLGVIQFS